jgi:hypothetical protein
MTTSRELFLSQCKRRIGTRNSERMRLEHWEWMVRHGQGPYGVRQGLGLEPNSPACCTDEGCGMGRSPPRHRRWLSTAMSNRPVLLDLPRGTLSNQLIAAPRYHVRSEVFMQFMTVEQIAQAAEADHDAGDEIAPGVLIERRTILRIGLSASVLLATGLMGCAGRRSTADASAAGHASEPFDADAVSIDDLVRQIRPQARELIAASSPDEEAYLHIVASLLRRVRPEPVWRPRSAGRNWEMDTIAFFPPIVLFQIKMNPGAVIHLHDHRHYNGVLFATEGTTRVSNFDIVQQDGRRYDIAAGEVPGKDEDFLIRRTSQAILRPGDLSTLSRDRDNIHHVEAGDEGCRLIDFFTHFRPDARSYELAWDGRMYDEAKGLAKVAWK